MKRSLLALTALVAGVLATACAPADRSRSADPAGAAQAMSHVHGLGVNPADGNLYVASHTGVYEVEDDGSARRVADRRQDTMAFTIVGPDRFLASGHPDLAENRPTHLGLIESTDGAETWQSLSLAGQADFHALDAVDGRINAYDSLTGRLLTSGDGQEWDVVAEAPVIDLATDPDDPTTVLATGPDAQVSAYDVDGAASGPTRWEAPDLVLIDWPRSDLLVGVGPDGQVHRSGDGGQSWTGLGPLPGPPQAIDVTPSAWHVATSDGLHVSTDDGSSWQLLVAFGEDVG